MLKPLDVVVALKIGCNEHRSRQLRMDASLAQEDSIAKTANGASNSVGNLAEALNKSKGDISRSINRLLALDLIAERKPKNYESSASNRKYYSLKRNEMKALLCHGIRHVFAPAKTGVGRGIATGWNCPWVQSEMNPPEMPLVWAYPGGDSQGELLEPLYPNMPDAAHKDKGLYVLLSLVEVMRTGKPRELKYAEQLLRGKIEELYS